MAWGRTIIQEWMVAQKRHHLSDMQVQMARELGFKPDSLRKIDNHKQELWKTPLPQHIENLYVKRFKREQPEVVKSLKQQLKDDEIKRKTEKKAKDARRAAKAAEESQCSPEVIEDSEDTRCYSSCHCYYNEVLY